MQCLRQQSPLLWLGLTVAFGLAVASCGHSHPTGGAPAHTLPALASKAPLPQPVQTRSPPSQLDGRQFPDRVLALTWDDGPDRHTVELARYLHSQHVSGTFFVVRNWQERLSAYPGTGAARFEGGYSRLPILEKLVSLGQRIGNHTLHHVVLPDAEPAVALRELAENQRGIDPFLKDELRLFRAPCGGWNSEMADLTHSDPYLGRLLGPVRWDIDSKDWAGSTTCNSTVPGRECEPFRGGSRLKPAVMAERYLTAIERAGRGIVLLHDRVADVGSSYALDLARHLLPALIEKHYVLAAPVLAFSPLVERESPSMRAALAKLPTDGYSLSDIDGDRKAELCVRAGSETFCSRSAESPDRPGDAPTTSFEKLELLAPSRHGLRSLLAAAKGRPSDAPPLLGDIDGDGATDACRVQMHRVVCMARAVQRLWLDETNELSRSSAGLADVDGDRRSDLCWSDSDGLHCALSTGAAFAKPRVWLAAAAGRPVFGDINGDGRGDVCLRSGGTIRCAFSTGDSFTSAATWLASARWRDDAWWGLGDINGDGRADLCTATDGRVSCGLAP